LLEIHFSGLAAWWTVDALGVIGLLDHSDQNFLVLCPHRRLILGASGRSLVPRYLKCDSFRTILVLGERSLVHRYLKYASLDFNFN